MSSCRKSRAEAGELGVGLVYWPTLAPLFEAGAAAVLELEPQTLWSKEAAPGGWQYRLNQALFEAVLALPQAKLMHGVGQPLAGSVADPVEHLPLLRRMAAQLDPAWVSEHLSFNRVLGDSGIVECGFLLPPLQSAAAARFAAANVQNYGAALGRPVAFETGVNYFRPAPGELADGEFFAAVAEAAGCDILLDLHNLWCNQRNGRQPVLEAVSQLPLERVREIHFAGGMALEGFWLDAHSDTIPSEVIDLAEQILPRLPRLGALVYEILPEHLPRIELDGVQRQLETLDRLWARRAPRAVRVRRRAAPATVGCAELEAVRTWEANLARDLAAAPAHDEDPGLALMRTLIADARCALLVRGMRFTLTSLLAGLGAGATRDLLACHFRHAPADTFVAHEAHRFAVFLRQETRVLESVPYLAEVFAFEQALLAATLFGESTELSWSIDPTRLLAALEAGQLPRDLPPQPSRMTVSA